MKDPVSFVVAVVLLLVTPGPTNTLLAASGVLVGVYRSMPLLLAELSGYVVSILAIGFLFGNWLASAPGIGAALRILSGVYLLVLAVRTWRASRGAPTAAPSFGRVLVTTLLNPKALIFALVIIPTQEPEGPLYTAAFCAIVPIVGCAWIAFGSVARRAVGGGYVWLVPKVTSIALTCFGAILIVKTVIR